MKFQEKDDIKNEQNEFKKNILCVLEEKYRQIILNENNDNYKNNIFQNIKVELRPGLFLNSLFCEKLLILKDLTNLSIEILINYFN